MALPQVDNRPSKRSGEFGAKRSIAIVTSIHPDFDARIWKHAKLVRDLGHEVHLVCPWNIEDGSVFENITFHTFPRLKGAKAKIWGTPRLIRGKLKALLPVVDLVHFHDIDLLFLMTLLSFHKPVIYDVHENYSMDIRERRHLPWLVRWPLSHAVGVTQFVCSRTIRNVVLVSRHQERFGFGGKWLRKARMRNFASVELLNDVRADYLTREDAVVYTASHSEATGSHLIPIIAELVHREAPHVKFYVSDRFWVNAIRERFLRARSEKGLEDVIVMLPNVRPHLLVRETLNRATIALMPNLRVPQQIHGAHNKTFEFMAAGLPIVSSDLPDQVEEVMENEAGLLARPEEPETFASAILKLVRDRKLAANLGRNGQRAFLEKYSWEAQGPALQAFYDLILDGKDRKAIANRG